MGELTIIKLGGSLLTYKSTPYKMRKEIFELIGKEIADTLDRVILIHGVGSFGHPPVKKYGLYKGYTGPENMIHLARTQSKVFELRIELAKALQRAGLNAMIILPSSQIIAENGEIREFFLEPITRFLKMGMVPLLGGDVVADTKMGFSVCSGDTVATYLAEKLGAKRLIFASDVDGIFTADPKKDPDARLIKEVNLNRLDLLAEISGSQFTDVTRGMFGKIESVKRYKRIIENGTEVVILSMLTPGNLRAYIEKHPDAKYTRIVVE